MIPHFAVPFALDVRGHAQLVEQDTPREVAQCVRVVVGTRPGERQVVPGFGLDDRTFEAADTVDDGWLVEAVAAWEPRADVDVVARTVEDARVDLTFGVG